MTQYYREVPAVNDTYIIDCPADSTKSRTDIDLGGRASSYTAGTITFRPRIAGAAAFEDLTGDDSIDLSAPKTLRIDSAIIGQLEIVVAGFSGSAGAIEMVINNNA